MLSVSAAVGPPPAAPLVKSQSGRQRNKAIARTFLLMLCVTKLSCRWLHFLCFPDCWSAQDEATATGAISVVRGGFFGFRVMQIKNEQISAYVYIYI